MAGRIWIEVIEGRGGHRSVAIAGADGCGQRVAGSKPWGGGTAIERWEVDADEVLEAVNAYRTEAPHGD